MTGEIDLRKLLQNMQPERHPGDYVFCTVDSFEQAAGLEPVCIFREQEGFTIILPKAQAEAKSLPYSLGCTWITLTVHSSLAAVGLTAAVSRTLAEENISCNIVAAYYHDHLFVPVEDGERAMQALVALTG
jgi:uncharacterized protein